MKIKPKTAVAINMFAYGVTTIVSTTQERIDWYFNEFKIQPDKKFGKGAGKRQLCSLFSKKQKMRKDTFYYSDIFIGEMHLSLWQEIQIVLLNYLNKINFKKILLRMRNSVIFKLIITKDAS